MYRALALAFLMSCTSAPCAWGWEHTYAVSGDVHQQRWELRLFQADLPDPNGARVETEDPTLGAWTARVSLDGRPSGPLPEVRAGASPAYDLATYTAKIAAISFDRAP